MNEVTMRFLTEIVDRVGADEITEVRLFRPLRQGPAETGVAVVAARSHRANAENTTDAAEGGGAITRHTVFSARYRVLIKGPDRGRWEVEVTPEADAPLITVDQVVQGVMRRAGEELEPERISAAALRAILNLTSPGGEPD